MTEAELKARTKQFGVNVIRLCDALPRTRSCDALARQLIRSASSVGANYRAACRGRSVAEVLAKLGTVEEEADESMFWLEVLEEIEPKDHERLKALWKEANELTAIVVASIKTLRNRL